MALIDTNLDIAYDLLTTSEIVAIPTETVYGLAGNALDLSAIDKIFIAKNRPRTNPLIVHISGIDELNKYVRYIPDISLKLTEKFWPGPLTILFPKSDVISSEVTANQPTVAIRIPQHPVTLRLLKMLPFPLVAPSANPSGYISPTSAQHVQAQLGDKIKYILDGGPCTKGIESTIIGFDDDETPVIYRKGIITPDDIKKIAGKVKIHTSHAHDKVVTAGMSLSHYSPKTLLYLTNDLEVILSKNKDKRIGIITLQRKFNTDFEQYVLSEKGDQEEAAKNLYAAMHYLDSLDLDLIVAEMFPDEGIGLAINDRLRRAADEVLIN